ncbi:MAG: hypothetical protein ABIJ00_15595, partial [Candidatus Eisenbacteria bacterium]
AAATSTRKSGSALSGTARCGRIGTAGVMKSPLKDTLSLARIPILRGKVGSYVQISRRKRGGGTGGYTGACFMKNRWVFRTGALRHGRKRLEEVGMKSENRITGCGIKGYGAQDGSN